MVANPAKSGSRPTNVSNNRCIIIKYRHQPSCPVKSIPATDIGSNQFGKVKNKTQQTLQLELDKA